MKKASGPGTGPSVSGSTASALSSAPASSSKHSHTSQQQQLSDSADQQPPLQQGGPEQPTSAFCFLSLRQLLDQPWDRLPKFQDIGHGNLLHASNLCSPAGGSPTAQASALLLLFISHRWEAQLHPDPAGRQLGALRSLATELDRLLAALQTSQREERVRLVPLLVRHATLQAVVLLGNMLARAASPADLTDDDPLQRVWVWYDYSCMPQQPRSDAEEQLFRFCLGHLDELIKADRTLLLALRAENDDYEQRGWCLAELALGLTNNSQHGTWLQAPLALRIDLQHERMPLEQQRGEQGLAAKVCHMWLMAEASAAEVWCEVFPAIISSVVGGVFEPEGYDTAPMVTLRHQRLARPIAGAMAALFVEASRRGSHAPIDWGPLLEGMMSKQGILCTNGADVARIALLMTVAQSGPELAGFWKALLHRHLEGLPLAATVRLMQPVSSGEQGMINLGADVVWEFAEHPATP